MKRILLALLFLSVTAQAQVVGPISSTFNSFRQNGISSVAATGDTVWVSPYLNSNIGNSADWFRPTGLDSIDNGVGRVFSLDVNRDTVVAGLGFTSQTASGGIASGYGYYITFDGGDTWRFSDFPLDADPPAKCINGEPEYVEPQSVDDYDPDCDILFTYGGKTYSRIRNTVPEQSPPYYVAFKKNVVFSANWASGLLRSTDYGQSWERVILPPFGVSDLSPDQNYTWVSYYDYFDSSQGATVTTQINRYDPIPDDNLKGFAVYIDSQNRVWYGSAGGINISENALTAPIDSISWRNVNFNNSATGLLARWIVEIQEDTSTGRVWMTNWLAESTGSAFQGLDQYGLVFTEDGGRIFEQRLVGEKIHAVTFKDGYVFAAGDNGVFISSDGGDTWVQSPQIKSANAILKSTASFQAAAATKDRVWIGSDDGIISTDDYGATWEINRVSFPLSGGNTYDPDAGTVKTYAYPNPFSPTQHEIVRIRFDLDSSSDVKVRIFDFGMNLVRELDGGNYSSGSYEAIWDGFDGQGRKVANGPYFYQVETSGSTVNGKILLIE